MTRQTDRLLSLAAGTVRDATRLEAIRAASASGFGAVGLRFDLDEPTRDELTALLARLDDTGLGVLDVEVVRLSPSWDESLELRLIEWAHAIGARHLLVVSNHSDRTRTIDELSRVAGRCREAGVSAVLEFMRFTSVRTLQEAVSIAAEVGPTLGGVLVDPLHLERSGGRPEDLSLCHPALFPYAQLCDAPTQIAADDLEHLAHEARHQRRLPGDGELPLGALIEQLQPTTPLSVEVQSDELERLLEPGARADAAWSSALRVIDEVEPS